MSHLLLPQQEEQARGLEASRLKLSLPTHGGPVRQGIPRLCWGWAAGIADSVVVPLPLIQTRNVRQDDF